MTRITDTRRLIEQAVRAEPGIHFNGLVRALDLATGQVQYHLKRLLAEESIVAAELYGRTHYYPEAVDADARGTLALLRRETTQEIVAALFEHESAPPAEIAEEIGVARSTLEWHLDRLMEQDIVVKRRGEGNRVILELADPEGTIETVRRTDPSLLEALVSGYTRLVDDMLFDGDS